MWVKTGFLSFSERSMLTEGKGEARSTAFAISIQISTGALTNKVMINSVTVWKDKETQDVSLGNLQILSDFLLYAHA